MSTQTINANSDEYRIKLKAQSEVLQNCQKENNLQSCFECERTFECEIRKKYVKAAYDSMSYGKSGGFEF